MSNKKIVTFEISRGTTHDGAGMRTTVFAKGCPLNCRWCQNPEGISQKQEVWFNVNKCIGCFECINACSKGSLEVAGTEIKINREKCSSCGMCTEICPARALTLTGTIWTIDGLFREVMKDKHFYDEFGGGVTLSGGEPLLYADFIIDFFSKLKANGVHTALDTCGCIDEDLLLKVIHHSDAILYDIKLSDNTKHMELTGRGNVQILENLKTASTYIRKIQQEENRKIQLWVRTPLIPGDTATAENIKQIAGFIVENNLDVTDRWELCAFNSACAIKYIKMQQPWFYRDTSLMGQDEINELREIILAFGIPEEKLVVTGIIRQ